MKKNIVYLGVIALFMTVNTFATTNYQRQVISLKDSILKAEKELEAAYKKPDPEIEKALLVHPTLLSLKGEKKFLKRAMYDKLENEYLDSSEYYVHTISRIKGIYIYQIGEKKYKVQFIYVSDYDSDRNPNNLISFDKVKVSRV